MVPLNKFLQQMLQVIFNPQSNDVLFLNLRDFIHVFLLILLRNNRCTINNSGKSQVKLGIN